MISLLKNIWNSFVSAEHKRQELKELYEKECNYLDELVIRKQQEELLCSNQYEETNKTFKETECSKRQGTITRLDSNHGFIDETIFFDLKVAAHLRNDLKEGNKVNYLLYRNPRTDHLTVVKIEGIVDQYWDLEENIDQNDEVKTQDVQTLDFYSTSQRNIPGTIIGLKEHVIVVETEYKTIDVNLKSVQCDFVPKEGDRIYLCAKVQNDEGYTDRLGEILEVLGVLPARVLLGEKCNVTIVHGDSAILNDKYYVSLDVLQKDCKLTVGDSVKADIIECERGEYNWRCMSLTILRSCKKSEDIQVATTSNRNENHVVTISEDPVCVLTGLGQKQTVNVTLSNNCRRTMTAIGVKFVNKHRGSAMVSLADPINETGFEIPSKSTFVLQFCVESKFFGESREAFIIDFGYFRIKRSILVNICEDEETAKDLLSKNTHNLISNSSLVSNTARNIRSRYYANKVWSEKHNVISGVSFSLKRRFVAKRIPLYAVPDDLRNAYFTNESKSYLISHIEGMYLCLKENLSFTNYIQRFKTLLFLEEVEYFLNFRKYDRERANFKHDGEYLALNIDKLSEKRPSLAIGDTVHAINPFVENSVVYEGCIHKVLGDKVLLKFNSSFHSMYRNEDYRLEFFFSRFNFRKSHFAIERITKHLGEAFLFPVTLTERKSPQLNIRLNEELNLYLNGTLLRWFNPHLNEFQRRAVYNVLRGEAFNMPYIIFGPPGTGKTVTIVETILQLLKNVHSARLIVATPSNSSANLIATRLIESGEVCPGDFVRLVSQNLIEQDLIPEHLMPYSATVDAGIDGTCKSEMTITESGLKLRCQTKYLGRHKITIGTCTTLGSYMLLNFPPDHFSHILIDEAGQCLESETMIPITLVTRFRGQVVLAGDPYQLQPVVVNHYAGDRGLELSFLERILGRSPYRKDLIRFPNSCGFDPRLVTKLLYNYRSLPSILKIFNAFFYDGELLHVVDEKDSREAKISKNLSQLFSDSNKRSNTHGIYFYGVRSENVQDRDSPSWYNKLEARNVFLWTIKLYRLNVLPSNIGIITPYSRQVKYLRNMFVTANVEIPKIGTVEEFQGQERDVILISTVRSSTTQISNDLKYALGFIRSKKRMNVAISRARCLMIVFGNPHLLYQDSYWHKFIKHCVENDAYEGCDLPDDFDTSLNGEN